MRTAWGYYNPLIVQYGIFLKNVFTKFDWGFCTTVGTFLQPVTEYLVSKLPATLYVNLCSLIFSIPMGIIFGVIAAIFKNKWQDQIINVFIMIFISIPSFVYAVLLQYWVGFKLGWAPLVMSSGTDYFSWTMFHSAIMPILALSFSTIAGDMRMIRAELSETLTSEYMLLARTKGLTRAQATMRHAFRNSLVPIIQGIRDQKYIDEKVYEVLEKSWSCKRTCIPLSSRIFRWTETAYRHCPCHHYESGSDHRRRTGQRAGRIHSGTGYQSSERTP